MLVLAGLTHARSPAALAAPARQGGPGAPSRPSGLCLGQAQVAAVLGPHRLRRADGQVAFAHRGLLQAFEV